MLNKDYKNEKRVKYIQNFYEDEKPKEWNCLDDMDYNRKIKTKLQATIPRRTICFKCREDEDYCAFK